MEKVVVLGGIAAFVGGLFYLAHLLRERARKSVRAVAAALRFHPGGFANKEGEWTVFECYEGTMEGLRVAVGYGECLRQVGERRVKTAGALIKTTVPVPPNFEYDIVPAGFGAPKNFSHSDEQFNRACAVSSNNGISMLSLLESPGIRSVIRVFLESSPQARLSQRGGWTVALAPYCKAEKVLAQLNRGVKVVKALADRADRLGFQQQKKAA